MAKLFCFGLGFSALTLARGLKAEGWTVAGTCREDDSARGLRGQGIDALAFDGAAPLADGALSGVTHLLISAPPGSARRSRTWSPWNSTSRSRAGSVPGPEGGSATRSGRPCCCRPSCPPRSWPSNAAIAMTRRDRVRGCPASR